MRLDNLLWSRLYYNDAWGVALTKALCSAQLCVLKFHTPFEITITELSSYAKVVFLINE